MKRYEILYRDIKNTLPEHLLELSKSGKWDGTQVSFLFKEKFSQIKCKNNLRHGLCKDLWSNVFSSWKKNELQGIQIKIKI